MRNNHRFPWMRLRKKTDPELPYEPPIMLGNKSNGEFFHEQTPQERRVRTEILRRSDDRARKLGMDRREFIASTMGMATSLSVLNMAAGCGDDNGVTSDPSDGTAPDGGYRVTRESMMEPDAADALMCGDEFIVDMQTHFVEDPDLWRERHPGRNYLGNVFADTLVFWDCASRGPECIGPEVYEEKILLGSDTAIAVLSGFPSPMCEDTGTMCNNPMNNDDMVLNRDRVNKAMGDIRRVIQHCQVGPNDNWSKQAALMRRIAEQHGNWGWKCYPPYGPGGEGWWLDDAAVADPFIELAVELADPAHGGAIICAHKGFPLPTFNPTQADPRDVGPAAVKWAEQGVRFVVYHSGFEAGQGLGPYDPDQPLDDLGGVDRLIRTIETHDLKRKNVYAEMGSAWALAMNDIEAAQHYIGKLLKYVGEDNVVWGSECTWFGSPQPQIEAFRNLEISEAFQEKYGYPALTKDIKAKIFGLSAAKLYKLDVGAARCAIEETALHRRKREMDAEFGDRRWAFQVPEGPTTRREFINLRRLRRATGELG